MGISLQEATAIVDNALAKGRELNLNPLTVVVLDAGGHLVALKREDNSGILRPQIAIGKAWGALALGMGSRAIFKRAQEQPYFVDAMSTMARGALVPVPGGVLINDGSGTLIGAVGVSGDTSDNDEICAVAGIAAAGLTGVTG